MQNKKNKFVPFVLFVIGTELVGYISSLLSGDISQKYAQLNKPPFSPAGQLFGIVWPILYAGMGIAVAIVYNQNTIESKQALKWYFMQLSVNFFWSILFFGLTLHWVALLVLVILDILVGYLLAIYFKINKLSFWLTLPYLIWILFATYLNLGIALLK
ncbi:TspO/MBR family protein [Scatolibacter rhodanostii]|uniref:TspO/MBR family protein n=1 Tax=Scatolibacter rhodanostii TaxID=2014781 RepID=UPI000C085746|nr:TspO/MBR family protein [Scatolibacter rhodanostii]